MVNEDFAMDYTVGSLADLISGSHTPNKRKVIQVIDLQSEEQVKKKLKRSEENLIPETQHRPLQKKSPVKRSEKGKKKLHNETKQTEEENYDSENDAKRSKKGKKEIHNETKQSEEENYDSENDAKRSKKGKKEIHNERKQTDEENYDFENDEKKIESLYNDRTIFVGNISINTTKNKLKKLFKEFGTIEAIRFRCVPTADPRVSKRVAMIKKEFHPDRQAMHSYIRFSTRDEAQKALAHNGLVYKDLHLRVNICDETDKPAAVKAIFIGNIPFDAEEEELWKLFEECGVIESVRLIRDSRTNIGKGFGYVNFKSPDAVHLALEMGEVKLKNRLLRVSQCKAIVKEKKSKKVPRIKKSKLNEGQRVGFATEAEENAGQKKVNPSLNKTYQGKVADKRKKKKFDAEAHRKKKIMKQIAPK